MLIVNAHQTPEFLVEVNQKIVQFLIENDAHAHVMDFFSPQTRQILDEFLGDVSFSPQQQTFDWLLYDQEYARLPNQTAIPLFIVFEKEGRPDAIWSLFLRSQEGSNEMGTASLPIQPPLIRSSISPKNAQQIIRTCLDLGNFLAKVYCKGQWSSSEYGPNQTGLSYWYSESRIRGASCRLESHLYVDLSLTDDEYRTRIRRRNRTTISSGLKMWKPIIYIGSNPLHWDEFRELHYYVSGRATRSKETWDIQYDMIEAGNAFAVLLRDEKAELVGGLLIAHSQDEGIYVSGAFNRTLNDQPLGHIAQWAGIQELKRREVKWYKLGERPYLSTGEKPDDKIFTIAHFKEGYATHSFPHIHYEHTA